MLQRVSPTNLQHFLLSTTASAAINVLLPKEGADLNKIAFFSAIVLFAIGKTNPTQSVELAKLINTAIVISTGGIWTGALLSNSVKSIATRILGI